MNIKKIMLIRPGRYLPFAEKRFSQPLGLLYLISILRQKFPTQFEIELIDQALYNLNFEQMKDKIKRFNPDLIGFSCLSVENNEMFKLSRIVKTLNPNCLMVLGGPHATFFYDYVLEKSKIDIVVIGEGEATFLELILRLQKDEPIDNIKGIAFKKNGSIVITPPRESIENLDRLPFPAWDIIDFKRYSKVPPGSGYYSSIPWAVIYTSRGCPFRCAYCHNNIFEKRTRFRSPENVIAEIELLTQKYGIKEIQIIDDIFNIDLIRAKRICDLIVKKGIKIKIAFPNGLRGDVMDRELIHKLKQAGCYSISYAVETASLRLQKLINKNLNLEKLRQVINWTNEEKIVTQGFFMLGFPSETQEEIEKTIKWARDSNFIYAAFSSTVIYPRTQLMEIAKKIYPDFDFTQWKMLDLRYWANTPFYTKITGIDLFKIQRRAYYRFYLKFERIFLIFSRCPKNLFFVRRITWFVLRIFFQFK